MTGSIGTIIVIALIAIPCYFGLKRIARSFSKKGGCGCGHEGEGSCHCHHGDHGDNDELFEKTSSRTEAALMRHAEHRHGDHSGSGVDGHGHSHGHGHSCDCCGDGEHSSGSCCSGSADDAGHEEDGKFNANCTHEHSSNGAKKCCCCDSDER